MWPFIKKQQQQKTYLKETALHEEYTQHICSLCQYCFFCKGHVIWLTVNAVCANALYLHWKCLRCLRNICGTQTFVATSFKYTMQYVQHFIFKLIKNFN